jgi:hypothetical protein
VDRFTRVVLGYHGCAPAFADALIRGETTIDAWRSSENPYDWLGSGIYFWEFAPERARDWSSAGGVVGAVIQLGTCLDLTDVEYTKLLAVAYDGLGQSFESYGERLPANQGKRRELDCLVVNEVVESAWHDDGLQFQTVRAPFLEGPPAFPGSAIRKDSHIQVVVRDRACILGVFRPNLTSTGAIR